MSRTEPLHVVAFQEMPGCWIVRGLEHDVLAEARTLDAAVRAVARLIQAQTEFDIRHGHSPLSAFQPAPQTYWNAFKTGTAVALAPFGVSPSAHWEIRVAVARFRPMAVCPAPGASSGMTTRRLVSSRAN